MTSLVDLSERPSLQLYMELAAKHGHYCPMSTLGLRIGWAARRKLHNAMLGATYHIQTCAADGICMALGCESLQVKEQGKHLLRFSDQENDWVIELLPSTLELAATYRTLGSDAERDNLLENLRNAEESTLMSIVQAGRNH